MLRYLKDYMTDGHCHVIDGVIKRQGLTRAAKKSERKIGVDTTYQHQR